MYLIALSTAAMWPGSKMVELMYGIVKIVYILALCSKLNAVYLFVARATLKKLSFFPKPAPVAAVVMQAFSQV